MGRCRGTRLERVESGWQRPADREGMAGAKQSGLLFSLRTSKPQTSSCFPLEVATVTLDGFHRIGTVQASTGLISHTSVPRRDLSLSVSVCVRESVSECGEVRGVSFDGSPPCCTGQP